MCECVRAHTPTDACRNRFIARNPSSLPLLSRAFRSGTLFLSTLSKPLSILYAKEREKERVVAHYSVQRGDSLEQNGEHSVGVVHNSASSVCAFAAAPRGGERERGRNRQALEQTRSPQRGRLPLCLARGRGEQRSLCAREQEASR